MSKSSAYRFRLWLTILTAGLFSFQPALAAVIEDILITAERREGSLQETPISITAFTGDLFPARVHVGR